MKDIDFTREAANTRRKDQGAELSKSACAKKAKIKLFVVLALILAFCISGLLVLSAGYVWPGIALYLVGSTPPIVFGVVALLVFGVAAPYKPLVSRDSTLWAWLSFMGKGSSGVLILVSSALIGGLIGAELANPDGKWSTLIAFSVVTIFAWLALVCLAWMIRALIDVARLSSDREETVFRWLREKNFRNPRQKARVLSIGADPFTVVTVGILLELTIASAYFWTYSALVTEQVF